MRVCTISIPIFFTIISSGVGAGPVGTAMARQKFFRLHSNDTIYCFKNNEAYCLNTIALPTYATDKRSPVIYRFNQSTNISAHLQAFQIDTDINTLKIFTLTLISKVMKVFTTTTTTTSLYDIPLFYYQ